MNNFIFDNAAKIYFGKGCVKEYLCCLTRKYGKRVLLAYGCGSAKRNGVYDEVIDILAKEGAEVTELAGIRAIPTYEKVSEGAGLAKERQIDWILGIGGGSVIDCCKAVSMASVSKKDIWENYWMRPGIIDFEPLPLGVIVTAAGAGSECNGCAVIANERQGIKITRDYPRSSPRFALMDPEYTYSVPVKQTAAGGFDILSHIMEAYFGEPDADNVSDDISEALMRSVIRNLRAAIQEPGDYTARSNLLWASAMGGNRLIRLGKRCNSRCYQMDMKNVNKAARFAENVWQIPRMLKSDEELARAGFDALEGFIRELGLPVEVCGPGAERVSDE